MQLKEPSEYFFQKKQIRLYQVPVKEARRKKQEYLERFQWDGFYLIDLSKVPLKNDSKISQKGGL